MPRIPFPRDAELIQHYRDTKPPRRENLAQYYGGSNRTMATEIKAACLSLGVKWPIFRNQFDPEKPSERSKTVKAKVQFVAPANWPPSDEYLLSLKGSGRADIFPLLSDRFGVTRAAAQEAWRAARQRAGIKGGWQSQDRPTSHQLLQMIRSRGRAFVMARFEIAESTYNEWLAKARYETSPNYEEKGVGPTDAELRKLNEECRRNSEVWVPSASSIWGI